jgi:Short C-terminal domain
MLGTMGLIILLIIFVGLAAVIVWVADWASGARRYVALAALNRRLASGEIDRAEYEEMRKLIGRCSITSSAVISSYLITSSARASTASGMVRLSAFAVLRLTSSSNLVGCSTGISPGFVPCRILSTKSAARRNRSAKLGP